MMKNRPCVGPAQSLTDIVTEQLRTAIINGEFSLGEKIPEEALSLKLGVSRTPIRDALARLQTVGLVTVKPKRGSFVFEPSSTDVIDLCNFRFMIELQAAKRSFSNSPIRLVRSLQLITQKMQLSMDNNDVLKYSSLDSAYHQMFFGHCDNRYLLDAFHLISNRISALRTSITSPQKKLREISFDEHHAMIGHLKRSDMAGFEKVLYTHIMRTQDIYLKALKDRKAIAKQA